MSFWEVVWFIVISFAFIAYLMVMFSIVVDLFRDSGTSGVLKAVWIVCLILFPLLTGIVYLVARGQGMAERSARDATRMREQQDAYIRSVAAPSGGNPASEIATAKGLLDSGAITAEEFDAIKARVLA